MEYFNGNGMEESISINDMIECDMRCNFNEQLGGNGDSQSGFPGMGSILDYDINSLDMTDSKATLASLISMNGTDLNWMNTLNLTSLQTFTKTENSDPNLMVNPQTGMPISCEQSMTTDTNAMLSAQAPNMNESAVREALLRRTPDPTTFVAVAPSQVQQPPQYIQQQIKQEPQQNKEPEQPTRQQPQQQQQSSNSQTIRQHLQAQVSHPLPSPQSPGSPYPDISSPQPMVVNSPQKSHPTPKSVVMTDVDKIYPKPVYSYSCLIAMALKNSDTGCLPVSEIYTFMTENFPYFKTAPDGWKNSVRHNLSLNKCFEKIENPKSTGTTKKGCLWAMNPAKIEKMEEEIAKWRKKDPVAIKRSMSRPEVLELLEAGNGGCRSPHHNLSTATSTNNNNNVTKPTTPITTTAPSELRLSKVVTNISANVNVIEIKPIKVDQTAAGGAGGATTVKEELTNLTPDELSVLDNNILDPAINDVAIQNGLFGAVMFDDFNSDELNLEDFQNSGSPLSFTLSSAGLTASPIHFNAGAASGTGNFIVTPNIDEKGAIQPGFNLFNSVPSSAPSTPASKYTVARTVTAQT